MVASVGAFGVSAAANLVLIPALSIAGAAIASTAGALVLLALAVLFAVRIRGRSSAPSEEVLSAPLSL